MIFSINKKRGKAVGTNRNLAHKPSKSQSLNQIYSRPMKNGTGLQPAFINGTYQGEKLHPDVARRMEEYAALKSLTTADSARMLT